MSNSTFAIWLCILAGAIGICGCKKEESHEPIVMMAVGLDAIRSNWIRQGRSELFDPTNIVQSSVEHFYNYTNIVVDGGKKYQCRFAGRSKLVHTAGFMAITDAGDLFWIYDESDQVISSPQRSGVPMLKQ